jgi:hypothetical protein
MNLHLELGKRLKIDLDVMTELKSVGALSEKTVRDVLIRMDFDNALRNDDYELIKQIFIDLSIKYEVSERQARRIVYDYMKSKSDSRCQC